MFLGLATGWLLAGCGVPGVEQRAARWFTYENDRYGFEFLYPSNWVSARPPSNGDGLAFVHPTNSEVEIRGWALYPLESELEGEDEAATILMVNFVTAQGVSGYLTVDLDPNVSSMSLSLIQDGVEYHWQGRSPSADFASYYQFFYYIASQYRIPTEEP